MFSCFRTFLFKEIKKPSQPLLDRSLAWKYLSLSGLDVCFFVMLKSVLPCHPHWCICSLWEGNGVLYLQHRKGAHRPSSCISCKARLLALGTDPNNWRWSCFVSWLCHWMHCPSSDYVTYLPWWPCKPGSELTSWECCSWWYVLYCLLSSMKWVSSVGGGSKCHLLNIAHCLELDSC